MAKSLTTTSRYEPTIPQQVQQKMDWLRENWASLPAHQCVAGVGQITTLLTGDGNPDSLANKQVFDKLYKSLLDGQNLDATQIELMKQNAEEEASLRQKLERVKKIYQQAMTDLKAVAE